MTSLTAPALAVDPDVRLHAAAARRRAGVADRRPSGRCICSIRNTRRWDEAILDAVDAVIAQLTDGGKSLADRTWGEANSAEIRHPLAGAIPFFGRYLNMPGDPLPGDVYTPRASTPRTGPSERMAVSPGRENEGILHVPDRPERPSALAALRRSIPRVAHRRADAVPARTHRQHARAHATPMNDINRRDFLKSSGAAAASLNLALAPVAP